MAHALDCVCALCTGVRARAVPVIQSDRDLLAEEWLFWIGIRDGEVAKLRAGEDGGMGSPRWVTLQAIARARLAITTKEVRHG